MFPCRVWIAKQHRKPAALEHVPLCVDLDGTLVYTDTLSEACLALLRNGLFFLLIPFWLLRGRAYLKKRVALHSGLDVATLPYNEELVEKLRRQFDAGRAIWLCTGADDVIAQKIAQHLPVFAGVIASDGEVNRVGTAKLREIEARFGEGGFDYVGNSKQDLSIWLQARESHVVGPKSRLLASMRRAQVKIVAVYERPRRECALSLWLRAIRIHQWAKNLLVFVPCVLAHNSAVVVEAVVGFVAFGLVASSGYLINDLMDLPQDRLHKTKRNRPFASGALSLVAPLALIPVLWMFAIGLSLTLPTQFGLLLAIYFVCSLFYSMRLK